MRTLIRLSFRIASLTLAVACCSRVDAQVSTTAKAIITADSFTSGNTKDILTRFYQLAFNNLTGPSKELNFMSSPFAIMLKKNPDLNLDRTYKKYQALRRLNFSFGLRLDSSYKFNGFSSGLKYSIIDQRDATTSRYLFDMLLRDSVLQERDILILKLQDLADKAPAAERQELVEKINNFTGPNNVPYSKLETTFQKLIDSIAEANKLKWLQALIREYPERSLKQADRLRFDSLKNFIQKDWLWIIGVGDITYQDKFQFSNVTLYSELSKGLSRPRTGKNSFELNVKAGYKFSTDTLRGARNLNREILSVESGLNWVVRAKNTDKSFFEFKLSSTYYHNSGDLYYLEERDQLTVNSTARVRIFDDIWIPVEIKYDPKTGNVFGFLNIKANFSGLGSLLKRAD